MEIIPLLAINIKATPDGKPTDDFYWKWRSSSIHVVRSSTISRPFIFRYPHAYNWQKFKQPGYRSRT